MSCALVFLAKLFSKTGKAKRKDQARITPGTSAIFRLIP